MTDKKVQIIHIVSEVIIIFCLTFYTISRNKKMLCYIEDLEQKIIQQEELLQNHDKLIMKLSHNVNSLQNLIDSQKKNENKIKEGSSKKVVISSLPATNISTSKKSISPLPTNISTSKKVMIMIPEVNLKNTQVPKSSLSKVEELDENEEEYFKDDNNNNILDDELENELNELNEEIISSENKLD